MSDILLEQLQKPREKEALYWKVFTLVCVSEVLIMSTVDFLSPSPLCGGALL